MSERVTFAGGQGRVLVGRLDLPQSRPGAYALFAHCFTCGKDSLAAARVSRALADDGFGVLRFDVPGLGESPGDFADTTFTCDIADLVAAADHLRRRDRAPSVLIGHSIGGAAVLAAAHLIPEARAVVTIGAPSDPSHVAHLLDAARAEFDGTEEAVDVSLAGRPFRLRRAFLDDIREQPQRERIATLDAALLVMHSPQDELVGIDNARQIYEAARHPKSFVSIDGADHLLTRPADARYVAQVLAAWASRYLDTEVPAEHHQPQSESEPGQVRVVEIDSTGLRQQVTARGHRWYVDEPLDAGGEDFGPTPYEMLLAGLGACTSMTMRLYARRKGWPLQSIEIVLEHGRIHAADCAECETTAGHLDHIQRLIAVSGALTDEQLGALAVIADKCPVHRTLTHEVSMETRIERA